MSRAARSWATRRRSCLHLGFEHMRCFAFGASDAEFDARRGKYCRTEERPCDRLRGFSSTMPRAYIHVGYASEKRVLGSMPAGGLLSTARSLGHTFGQSASSRGRSACIPASTVCAVRSNLQYMRYSGDCHCQRQRRALCSTCVLRQHPNVTDCPCQLELSLC